MTGEADATALAVRLRRAADALDRAARMPPDQFDGVAAEAFRRRARCSAARARDGAAQVAPAADEPGEQPPVLPPGARDVASRAGTRSLRGRGPLGVDDAGQ